MLSERQLESLNEDGFVRLDGVLSDGEVAELGALCDELMETGDGVVDFTSGVETDDISPVARRPEIFRPQVVRMSGWDKLVSLAGEALGPDSSFCNSAFFAKPPRVGSETIWHQDEAFYPAEHEYHELKAWAALDDIDDTNSPLEYVPGSHRLGVLPHRTIDDKGRAATLADVDRYCRNVKRMLMKAGDVLLHHGYMLHHSPPNRSDRARRALVISMMLPPTLRPEPIEMPWKKKLFRK